MKLDKTLLREMILREIKSIIREQDEPDDPSDEGPDARYWPGTIDCAWRTNWGHANDNDELPDGYTDDMIDIETPCGPGRGMIGLRTPGGDYVFHFDIMEDSSLGFTGLGLGAYNMKMIFTPEGDIVDSFTPNPTIYSPIIDSTAPPSYAGEESYVNYLLSDGTIEQVAWGDPPPAETGVTQSAHDKMVEDWEAYYRNMNEPRLYWLIKHFVYETQMDECCGDEVGSEPSPETEEGFEGHPDDWTYEIVDDLGLSGSSLTQNDVREVRMKVLPGGPSSAGYEFTLGDIATRESESSFQDHPLVHQVLCHLGATDFCD
jgi:hypothetical protein